MMSIFQMLEFLRPQEMKPDFGLKVMKKRSMGPNRHETTSEHKI